MILLMQKLLVLYLASTAIDLAFPNDTSVTSSLVPDVPDLSVLDKLSFMEYNTEP